MDIQIAIRERLDQGHDVLADRVLVESIGEHAYPNRSVRQGHGVAQGELLAQCSGLLLDQRGLPVGSRRQGMTVPRGE